MRSSLIDTPSRDPRSSSQVCESGIEGVGRDDGLWRNCDQVGDLDAEIMVYEPTSRYQNAAKRGGVENLTPARALIAELVRSYWVMGIECSLPEIQKLSWFLERAIEHHNPGENPLALQFTAHKYGPYTNRLRKLLDSLDGSYLHCEKRISDSSPFDVIWFDDARTTVLRTYLKTEAKAYDPALQDTIALIEGFESPFGLELLATVDWLLFKEGVSANVKSLREALRAWPGGEGAAQRKSRLFDDRMLGFAIARLTSTVWTKAY